MHVVGTISWQNQVSILCMLILLHIIYSVQYNIYVIIHPGTASSGEKTYQNAMPIGNGHMAAVVNYESAQDTVVCTSFLHLFNLKNYYPLFQYLNPCLYQFIVA